MAITKLTHHATSKQWKTLTVFGLGQNFFIFYSRTLSEYVVEECAKDLVNYLHRILIIFGILSV